MITIEEFIKHYNQNIDWNLEIRSKLDVETIKSNTVTEDLLDGYLSTKKLTEDEEDYEWKNAQLYKLDDYSPDDKCMYELQVYDFTVYSTMNFRCNPYITKEEYIRNRVDIISKEVTKSIKIHQRNIQVLERELHCMKALIFNTIMDYEKLYKEALERAKGMWEQGMMPQRIEYIFPELKESEDERIRKSIIELLNEVSCTFKYYDINKMLSWLEKQGKNNMGISEATKKKLEDNLNNALEKETPDSWDQFLEKYGEQKPVDKVEPKVGDWVVVSGKVAQILYIKENCTVFRDINGKNFLSDYPFYLWTIQDAKDGDVLCCENGWTCIFKTLVNVETFSSYCFMDTTKWFCETGSECHTLKEEFVKSYNGEIYPATKEQCDILFQKMKEAGYEWDSEKKELKNIDNWVDLALPSGTLWKSINEEGYYAYDEAVETFGDQLPTKEQFEELKEKCTWVWQYDGNYKVIGQNGNFITFDLTHAWYLYFDYSGVNMDNTSSRFEQPVRLVKNK